MPDIVDYLIKSGVPPYKVILGLATYGRTFILKDAGTYGLGAPTETVSDKIGKLLLAFGESAIPERSMYEA